MSRLFPFRALRPRPEYAARIAAVPYDVVTADEARALAEDNPMSFLRVSRAEIELPAGADPYSDEVYERAGENFETLKRSGLMLEEQPAVYFYRLRMGAHVQTGVAACYSIEEYDRNIIKKHERTRRDKEDDRTRHMLAVGAQTGPVFLAYRAQPDIDRIEAQVTEGTPLYDFEAVDGVRHTIWRAGGGEKAALVGAFGHVPALYIADGHHRAASAARARADIRDRAITRGSLGDTAGYTTFLAAAFPHDQVQVLPYNRTVTDLGGLAPEEFLQAIGEQFVVDAGPATPARRGEIAMYFQGRWQTLRPRVRPTDAGHVASLDVSLLQEQLLEPILKIADVRTDKRIDFIGGARGTAALEQQVSSGRAVVAFSLYPVSVADLMSVADAGGIMPPKSTWFEPKLRDGLLIHLI